MSIETDILAPLALENHTPSMKRAQKWIDYSGPVGIVKQRVARQKSPETEQEEYTSSESVEDAEKQGFERPESCEPAGATEPEVSKGETCQEDQPELERRESRENTPDDNLDSAEEHEESDVETEPEDAHKVEESFDEAEEHDEPEVDELEHANEPIEGSDEESPYETTSQEGNDDVRSSVESSERVIEDPDVDEISGHEISEAEELPEELEDFVKRVQDIMDEKMDADDDYDYVQDPLTGEIQRVPKILSEYETEEQSERRKLRNLFAELSEEEREQFKELVREKAESEDERSAEEIERQWTRVVEKAEQEREELLDKVSRVFESPDVFELLESMSEDDEGSHTSAEYVDDEVDENESLDETLEQFLPATHEEFQEALRKHSNLRKRKRFEQELEHTRIYYQCKEEIEKTDFSHMSKREVWKHLSKKYGVPPTTLKNWFAGGTLPRLLRAVRDEQAKAAGLNPQKKRTPTRLSIPETYDEFMSLLTRHPYLRDAKGFEKLFRDVQEYYRLREIAQRSPGLSYSELSRHVDVPFDTARSWVAGRSKPDLLNRLLKNEKLRRKMESDFQTAFPMMVDPSEVYDTLCPLRVKKNQTLKQIADALERLISNKESITIVRLKPYNSQHGPRWLLDIAKKIRRNREKIQCDLQNATGLNLRLGQANGSLYIWNDSASQFDYLELYSKELFFFNNKLRKTLTQNTMKNLGLKGNYMLSQLIKQITPYSPKGLSGEGRLISDLRPTTNYIRGEVLKFILDSLDMKLKDIEGQIERIGVGEQIINPKFPDEESFKILMARLYASIGSDGSIDDTYKVQYYENVALRRKKIRQMVQILGSIRCSPLYKHDGSKGGLRLPSVIGRLIVKLGMPVGDKILQGVRIPHFIMYGSPEVQLAYLQDLIPEEGCVTINAKDNIRISWGRSVILYDAKKEKKYNFEQKISLDLVLFIENHGTRYEREYTSGVIEIYYTLTMGDLRRFMESDSPENAAKAEELDCIIRENPSDYIEDEKHLCAANGIMTSEQNPGEIRRSISSDRVSVKWYTRASSEDYVALWGLIASPNDERKKQHLNGWMKRHRDKVEKARKKLKHSRKEIDRLQGKDSAV